MFPTKDLLKAYLDYGPIDKRAAERYAKEIEGWALLSLLSWIVVIISATVIVPCILTGCYITAVTFGVFSSFFLYSLVVSERKAKHYHMLEECYNKKEEIEKLLNLGK